MSLAERIVRSILRMPNQRPSLSVVLTGVIGVLALAIGFAVVLAGGDGVPMGVTLLLASLAVLAAAAHAGRRTGGLQRWQREIRGQRTVVNGHVAVRWMGPVGLLVVFVCCFAWLGVLVLTTNIIRAATSSHG